MSLKLKLLLLSYFAISISFLSLITFFEFNNFQNYYQTKKDLNIIKYMLELDKNKNISLFKDNLNKENTTWWFKNDNSYNINSNLSNKLNIFINKKDSLFFDLENTEDVEEISNINLNIKRLTFDFINFNLLNNYKEFKYIYDLMYLKELFKEQQNILNTVFEHKFFYPGSFAKFIEIKSKIHYLENKILVKYEKTKYEKIKSGYYYENINKDISFVLSKSSTREVFIGSYRWDTNNNEYNNNIDNIISENKSNIKSKMKKVFLLKEIELSFYIFGFLFYIFITFFVIFSKPQVYYWEK